MHTLDLDLSCLSYRFTPLYSPSILKALPNVH